MALLYGDMRQGFFIIYSHNYCVIMSVYIMEWIIDYYKNASGVEPVREFLNSLPKSAHAKAMRLIDTLSEYGVLLKNLLQDRLEAR